MGECGEVYVGDLRPGEIHMEWSVPRVCTRPEGHKGDHTRWPCADDAPAPRAALTTDPSEGER